jgi:hypothetical protein
MDMTTFLSKERSSGDLEMRQSGAAEGWLDNRALAELVLETVRQVDEKELNPPAPGTGGPAFRPRMILAALTYCYALGIFSSLDIEELMRADGGFRALCGMDFPDWRRLRRFRRHNHEAVRRALEETIRRVWSLKSRDQVPRACLELPEPNGYRTEAPRWDESPPLEWCAQEAERRIEHAMFIDQMTLDD